jgi:hypothetical protein
VVAASAFMPAMVAPPLRKLNLRVLIFAGLVFLLLVWPIYMLVRNTLSHGIIDRGSYKEVNLKALGNFPLIPAKGTMNDVPERFRALDGRRVQLEGLVGPPLNDASRHPGQFQFVYNIQICCFGGPPYPQERVFCKPASGCADNVYADPGGSYRMVGILHVNVQKDETGNISSVYTMDVEKSDPIQ